ncbi:MAG: D-sedoheptulose 7-phosphate isomerase [Candidatus Niyogibacteria bacterium]|nr:D-sedoheptulose 7-phosphate isomerase [Candidatus Niyogibacteria bacterium]
MREEIILKLKESGEVKIAFAADSARVQVVRKVIDRIRESFASGGKILIFGNGGSAADAQHIAAEFINRYAKDRKALPAIALTTDTSILTSIGNDSSFENIFSRQIEALGSPGDIAWGISTSGKSLNIVRALEVAKSKGLVTIGFTGREGGNMKDIVDYHVNVPVESTARIQEVQMTISHIICELIENNVALRE